MRRLKLIASAVAPIAAFASVLFAPAVQAQALDGFVDVYYLPWTEIKAKVEDDNGNSVSSSTDGDGYGIKGLLRLNDNIAFDGEYQKGNYDGDADRDSYRAGAGYYWRYFGIAADYINESVDDGISSADADGVGIYLRTSWLAVKGLAFTGAIGYVRLDRDGDTYDGIEYNVGLDVRINDYLGLFADYRSTDLSHSNLDLRLSDARAGVRLVF
ncbi:hypothetical protein [Hydrocarboniphaga sp.]|uniref:hypothetical protein n=1 Tax=Hydrocarboniphaga sp. TaxID=2033016 RepID=UPI003D0DE31C